jgi:hypothetical protein
MQMICEETSCGRCMHLGLVARTSIHLESPYQKNPEGQSVVQPFSNKAIQTQVWYY